MKEEEENEWNIRTAVTPSGLLQHYSRILVSNQLDVQFLLWYVY
jgi:hypothetical protein